MPESRLPPATNGALTWVLYQEAPDLSATQTTATNSATA